ncbi:NAD(P)-dependent oxidoreductase [Salarchaeum japonicum]|uniref:C-terminal binding protein n=1 Tax=Salarchaeum japonicum TaxID=555573 RepID=A0AAV3T4J6_9EURY|nr:NAD(P)-dependent oxidoreductase [Salarchaeum japonicum]
MVARIVVDDDPKYDPSAFERAVPDAAVAVGDLDTAAGLRAHADADVWVTPSTAPVTADVLADASVRLIAQPSIGVDNVDVAAAAARGVTVVHAADYCVDEVATHALSLLLACVRSVPAYDASVRDGEWDWRVGAPIHRLAGATVGLVSFGPIARAFRDRLRGFDADVLAYDPYVDADVMARENAEKVTFEELTARADHVSVHAPLTDETRGLVGRDALARLRDDAVVVNVGRGGVVDEAALVDALESGDIAAAGLDVFETEPLPAESALRDRDDVVLTPHAGWYSAEAMADANESVAADVRRFLDGETPAGRVDPDADWL